MTLKGRVIGMAKATHFGPTVLVVSITFALAITQLSFSKSVGVALAILAGQCVVGWTNELVDHGRDTEAGRTKKPLVSGSVTRKQLQIGIAVALTASVLLSFFGPLGIKGGWLHMLGLGSATIYNFWAKSTWFSPLPYAISFGALPWAIYSVVGKNPPAWLFIDFILVSLSFHFLNVIKDLEWDRSQTILGLPQRIGKRWSAMTAGILIVASLLATFLLRGR
jgi:4-hydroxybenzoate polyprenyltransferase